MNKKVRMTVAIPAEKGSTVDGSAFRRIKKMSFPCLHTMPARVGNKKGYIDDCKNEVRYRNDSTQSYSILIFALQHDIFAQRHCHILG